MEAKGHEKLMDRTTTLLDEKLKSAGYTGYNLNSYYLGNWIADFSQLNDESIKFLVYKAVKYPSELIDLGIRIFGVMEESFKNLAPVIDKYLIFEKVFIPFWQDKGEVEKAIKNLNELVGSLKNELIDLKKSIDTEIDKKFYDEVLLHTNDVTVETIRSNISLNHIELALALLAKFIGYNKFSLNTRPVIGERMEQSLYDKIFDELFQKYLPHEHLDRPFDSGKLDFAKEINTYDLSYLITSGKALDDRKDLNDKSGKKLGFYTYLDEFLTVACGKLSQHEEFFKGKNNMEDKSSLNKEIARVGNTMHVFQDYFAHSNFIDFSNVFLYRALQSKKLKSELNKPIDELFFGKKKYSAFEVKKSTRSTVNVKTKKEDTHIFTGYFDSVDTKTSLYHLLLGSVSKISETDPSKSVWDEENLEVYGEAFQNIWAKEYDGLKNNMPLDMLFARKAALTRKMNNSRDSKERAELEEQINELNELILSKKQFRELITGTTGNTLPAFVTVKDTKALFSYRGSTIDSYGKHILIKIINALIYAKYASVVVEKAKSTYDTAKEIASFIEILFTIVRVIILIYYFPQNILRIISVVLKAIIPGFVREPTAAFLKDASKDILERFLTKNLEYYVGRKYNNQSRHGSHSLIAKDDDFKQDKLSGFALDMAENLDRFILYNLFYDSKPQALYALEYAISKNLPKIVILGYEYDLSVFSPVKNYTKEELYLLLVEKDKKDNHAYGLHKKYCDWDFYIKNMISFRNGIPASSERMPTFRTRNLKQDTVYNMLPSSLKFNYFLNWEERHKKIINVVPIYSDAKIPSKDDQHTVDSRNSNKKSYNAYIDALNKTHDSKQNQSSAPPPLIMSEIEDTRLTTWFFRILMENKEGYRNNNLLNYWLQKTIDPDEQEAIKGKSKELEDRMIKEYREIAIKTTYLPEK